MSKDFKQLNLKISDDFLKDLDKLMIFCREKNFITRMSRRDTIVAVVKASVERHGLNKETKSTE